MATLSWVKVTGPYDRNVFVNGQYAGPAGKIDVPFRVETGLNTFETLDAGSIPDWSADAVITVGHTQTNPQIVVLEPVAGG